MAATGWRGRVDHIHITSAKSQPMQALEEARLIAGEGVEGDRYLLGTGTYSINPGADRQLTLIESEMLARVAEDFGEEIAPHEHRRNVQVSGVPLQHLVGLRFRIGECLIEGVRINQPCKYLNLLLKRDVYKALLNRSGLNCRIVEGGIIRRGDVVEMA